MIQLLHYRKLPLPLFFIALLFMGGTAMAQKTWIGGPSGNWNTAGNWSPSGVPGIADAVTISNSANIDFNAGVTNIGSLIISGNSTVQFSPAAGSVILRLNAAGVTLDIQSGSRLDLEGINAAGTNNFSLLFNTGAGKTGNIAGILSVDIAGPSDAGVFSTANSVTTVTGVLRKAGGTINSSAGTLVIGATGTYNHAMDDNSIVSASWNFGSTLSVTGVIATLPTSLNQAYSNLIWDCVGQTGNFALFPNFPTAIPGSVNIISTGSGSLRLTNNGVNRNVTVNGNFTQTGGTFIVDNTNGGSTLNVDGTLQLGGTQNFVIAAGGGNATVNANGPFTVSGGTFTMSSSTAQGILNAAGNFTHSAGTIEESSTGSGLINFNGTGTQTFASGSGPVSGDIRYQVASGATLQMAAASTVVASSGGSFTLSSGATLGIRSSSGINLSGASGNIQVAGPRDFSPGANYTYNGTAAQTTGDGIPLNLTGVLTIANLGGVTLNNAKSIGNGGTIALQSGLFATGTNLTLNSTSTISRGNGTISGAFQGTGDYNVEYTTLGVAGAELQGGQGLENRLNNLTINLSTSNSFVSLNTETRVKGVLTLTNGKLVTTSTNILVMTATATTAGGSSSSFVSGPMRKLGTSAFVFPIGNGLGTGYRPMAVSGSNSSISAALSAPAEINATVSLANPLKIFNNVFLPDLLSLTNCLWWNIQRTDAGVNNVFIWLSTGDAGPSPTVNFVSGCFVGTPTPPSPGLLRVAHYVSNQWQSLGNNAQVQTANAWFIGAGTGIASFSPFTVGSAEGVLPVTFTSFTGLKDGNSVKLNWETSSEQNSAYFDVERSSDGVNFSSIGKVNAAGNSATLRKYSFTDNNPSAGRNFYRLRQVDLDAKFEYSKTISVNMAVNAAVSIYPNPVQSNMMVEYPKVGKGAIYKVISVDGRVMQSGALQENSSQQNINLSNLQRGNYILVIQNDGQQYVQKIMKQ